MNREQSSLCVIGDVHGHLQLALCIAAQWQRALETQFEAVLLCGDVGAFTEDSQLDSTTRRHAKCNACELEFLYQWSVDPQPTWLQAIFAPVHEHGLGLECPVVMVHGNHDGFDHLAEVLDGERREMPSSPIAISELPVVDSGGHIAYLPSGWKCATKSDVVIGGVGGIERGQRHADYHELAYLDEAAILHLLGSEPFDVLITHQGPRKIQGDHGSELLDHLLDAELCRFWFHGHSTPQMDIVECGPNGRTTLIPLRDAAFPLKGLDTDEPGEDAWCWLRLGEPPHFRRERPAFWREFRKRKWTLTAGGQLVAPPLSKVKG